MASAAPTFADYLRHWLPRARARTRPRTIYLYEWLIARYLDPLRPLKLKAITRNDVHAIVTTMREASLASATIKQVLTILGMILTEAVEDDLILRNVAAGVARKIKSVAVRPPTVYTPAQILLFMDHAERQYPSLAPLFSLCSGAGLRIGEARGIRADDLDLGKRQLHVRRSIRDNTRVGPTKSGKPRTVDLPTSTVRLLAPYQGHVGWCFPGREHGTVISYTTVRLAMRAICEATALPGGAPHALRHAHASALAIQGVPLIWLKEQLGHADIKTTMLYAVHLRAPRPAVLDAL